MQAVDLDIKKKIFKIYLLFVLSALSCGMLFSLRVYKEIRNKIEILLDLYSFFFFNSVY